MTLMIHAQRPDATACAEYDYWNEKMQRYVRRGSKGIALIDTTGDRPKLRYVFDVSDTGERDISRRVNLWELSPEHNDSVTAMLERNYDAALLTEKKEAYADYHQSQKEMRELIIHKKNIEMIFGIDDREQAAQRKENEHDRQ